MDHSESRHRCSCGYPLGALPPLDSIDPNDADRPVRSVRCPECGKVQVPRVPRPVASLPARLLLCGMLAVAGGLVLILFMNARLTGPIVLPTALIGLLLAFAMPIVVASSLAASSRDRDLGATGVIATLILGWLLNAIIAGAFFWIGFLIALPGQWGY